MLGTTEMYCVDAIIDLIKDDPDFRPIMYEDDTSLFEHLDVKKNFLTVKGSYANIDSIFAARLNYEISAPENSAVSMIYRFRCNPPAEVTFTRETSADKVTKKIGLHIEIEIDNQIIDDNYLIHSGDLVGVKKMLEADALRLFLEGSTEVLEKFELAKNYLEYQRSIPIDSDDYQWIDDDLAALVNVVNSLKP